MRPPPTPLLLLLTLLLLPATARAQAPPDALARAELARLEGRDDDALDLYLLALREHPQRPDTLLAFGRWYFEDRLSCPDAQPLLLRAVELLPPDRDDLRLQALPLLLTCAERDRDWNAVTRWTRLLAQTHDRLRDPRSAHHAWRRHAHALARTQQLPEAEALLNTLLRQDAADMDARLLRADVRLQRGDLEQALTDYLTLRDLFHPPLIHLHLGLALVRLERWPQALEALKTSLREDGEQPSTWSLIARCFSAMQQHHRAEWAYRRALELTSPLDPASAGLRNNLAWLLTTRARPSAPQLAEALQLAQSAVRDSNALEPIYTDTLAEVYLRLQQPELALPWAETSARLQPLNPTFARQLRRVRAHLRGIPSHAHPRLYRWEEP